MSTSQVITVPITEQQHLLFLFLPLKKGLLAEAIKAAQLIREAAAPATAPSGDLRKTTGVHYFTIYAQEDGKPTPGIPVPGFQSFPGKDVMVVMSIYDGQFDAYINAFFEIEAVVNGLNGLLHLIDETGIPGVDPDGPTSAKHIIKKKGVKKNAAAFFCFLMRYNFGDPVFSAGDKNGKYTFGTNFPGLTVAKIIDKYPKASEIWPPAPSDVTYSFPKAQKPDCK
ncbi:hypothetical protein [Flavobacterium lipolyticum]|uniref:Gluconate 2-dehydrogenase subunit 3 family protein n=1 Tax=Flavobacterium lipolyticum TaxID=2893754 RepID=A0ABS8LZN5_9FLAO|nr:hypothetical protein [Flavobacterium sp. F-126]MCC9017884.1 hypothetical protein [Flavobacterium sp. F-126]